jgi:hypothetical protein
LESNLSLRKLFDDYRDGRVAPKGLSRGCAMTEYTARSFSSEYRVFVATARQYLKRLVQEGKATAVKKPLRIRLNGKEVVTKRMVTTYRVNGFTKDHC